MGRRIHLLRIRHIPRIFVHGQYNPCHLDPTACPRGKVPTLTINASTEVPASHYKQTILVLTLLSELNSISRNDVPKLDKIHT